MEHQVESDIQQLRGLGEYGGGQRILPNWQRERYEDFDPDSRRMRDLRRLIDRVATRPRVKEDMASIKGLNKRSTNVWLRALLNETFNAEVWFGVNLRPVGLRMGRHHCGFNVTHGAEANISRALKIGRDWIRSNVAQRELHPWD